MDHVVWWVTYETGNEKKEEEEEEVHMAIHDKAPQTQRGLAIC